MLERLNELGYKLISPIVSLALDLKIGANKISVLSFLSTITASFLLNYSTLISYTLVPLFIFLDAILDLVDGEVARRTNTETKGGDFLDHTLDRYKDSILVLGATAGTGNWKIGFFALCGILLTAYMGTGAQAIGQKRIYRGILTRADFLAILSIGSLVQLTGIEGLKIALIAISIGGILTSLERFTEVLISLSK